MVDLIMVLSFKHASSIWLLKSIFTMLSNLSDVDFYHLFNMTAVKRKSEQANMPYFSTFLTKLHKMSGNDTTINYIKWDMSHIYI